MQRLLAALLIFAACIVLPTPGHGAALAFTHVTVVDVTGGPAQHDMTVVTDRGYIAAIGTSAGLRLPAGARVIPARGKYLIPGLWDMHVHTVFGAWLPRNERTTDMEQIHKVDLLWPEWQKWGFADLRSSIGLLVEDDGTVLDSAPSLAGYDAGIMPGMVLTGVNGGPFSLAALEASVRATRDGGKLELNVANGKSSAVRLLDYRGGLRYPHLQRDPTKPDLLREIVAPHATQASMR